MTVKKIILYGDHSRLFHALVEILLKGKLVGFCCISDGSQLVGHPGAQTFKKLLRLINAAIFRLLD